MTHEEYSLATDDEPMIANLEVERLRRERQRYEKALVRLKDVYLFSDEGISPRDYIFRKHDMQKKLEKIETDMNIIERKNEEITSDIFINNALHFTVGVIV